MFSLSSLFGGRKKSKTISNKHITVPIPEDFLNVSIDAHDILYIEKYVDGLCCALAIDNIQELLYQPNAVTIKKSTPKEVLADRLESIGEETIETTDCNWSNFSIAEPVTETTFKNYPAAVGAFTVDEAVNGTTQVIQRKIKRLVVFVKGNLWNIVLAPSQLHLYESEMNELEGIIETLQVK